MNAFGAFVTFLGIFLGIQLGDNGTAFIDVPALLFVLMVGLGILLASHGIRKVWNFICVPISSSFTQTEFGKSEIKCIAETGITAFVAAGWIGSLIGVVQMLTALDDPSKLGVGTAVALLTAFYGYIVAYAICYPMARRCEE